MFDWFFLITLFDKIIRLNKALKDIVGMMTKISMAPQDMGIQILDNMVDLANRYGKDSNTYP